VNVKSFFVDTLTSALELGIATPDDVLRHVTPDVLSLHLPRPLWARLLTAALGAPRLDAQLVVETIGMPNLCEHIPSTIIWGCIADLGQRALSGVPAEPISKQAAMTPPAMKSQPIPLAAPPPPEIKREAPPAEAKRETPPRGTQLPSVSPGRPSTADGIADVVAALESNERQAPPAGRSRTPTGQRFRQSSTGMGRLASINTRRPQAPVPATDDGAKAATAAPRPERAPVDDDEYEIETDVSTKDEWKGSLAVEDEQLVEWQGAEETSTGGEVRKR
jgi:hypothetical protein